MRAFEAILDELRASTGAGRATLRLQSPVAPFPVVAESLGPEVVSIKGDDRIDPTETPTFQLVEHERRIFLQSDCLTDPPIPGRELVELYGVRAQMLAPVERQGQLVGVISVHHTACPRSWSSQDVAALERAVERVVRALDRDRSIS
jgi:maleate isomerase